MPKRPKKKGSAWTRGEIHADNKLDSSRGNVRNVEGDLQDPSSGSTKRSSGYSYRKTKDGSRILYLPILKNSPFLPNVATIQQQKDKTVLATLEPSIATLPCRQFTSLDEAATILLDLYFNLQPAIITWIWKNHPEKFWSLVPKKWSYRSIERVRCGELLPPKEVDYAISSTIFPPF